MKPSDVALFFLAASAIVGPAQDTRLSPTEVYTHGTSTSGIRVAIELYVTSMSIVAEPTESTPQSDGVKNLVSLTLDRFGPIELSDSTGQKLKPRDPQIGKHEGYPDSVGGQYATNAFTARMRRSLWTFPINNRSHLFIPFSNNGRYAGKSILLSKYFQIGKAGTYHLKYWPKFYLAEDRGGTHAQQVDPPPRYSRIDFPPIELTFTIGEENLKYWNRPSGK